MGHAAHSEVLMVATIMTGVRVDIPATMRTLACLLRDQHLAGSLAFGVTAQARQNDHLVDEAALG
jgi:hypothetical protein